MTKEILCTLGPASMNDRVIGRLSELGVALFRINLSHTDLADLPDVIDFVQSRTQVPVCLDTEGAQIRTGGFTDGAIEVRDNTEVVLHRRRVPGDSQNWNLFPRDIIGKLEVNDIISIDFNAVLIQIVEAGDETVVARVLNGGAIGRNKAVTVRRDIPLPPLTEKDRASLVIGRDKGIKDFALSFANSGADVDTIRAIIGDDARLIYKIETLEGMRNLEAIAAGSEALLIDRGDLSRQIPIEGIPGAQKSIIARTKAAGRKVYVATNLLETMVSSPQPTRAEVNDIFNTLADGADGLVLAAETAIGAYPVECANMIVKMIHAAERNDERGSSYYNDDTKSLLVEPHGGRLVHREASADDRADIDRLPVIEVDTTQLVDCQHFAIGTYSPLMGFMNSETLASVLAENRLPDGTVWTLPLVLQLPEATVKSLGAGARVLLREAGGEGEAILDVDQVYRLDLEAVASQWFGTSSFGHPGGVRFFAAGEYAVAGAVTLVRAPRSTFRHIELNPEAARYIFTHTGWTKVIAFHTRNAIHRVHEHLILDALERTGADGVYVNPVTGIKKSGDFLPEPIMRSYQATLDFGYLPREKVVLGSFSTYSRYAGPREAVFTALCRKNMGCSHFIIGRDHTGVGDFYPAEANRALFDSLGDIGIEPVFFDAVGYDPEAGTYSCEKTVATRNISGTQVRQALQSGEPLPDWFMRDVVQDVLRSEIDAGGDIFVP
ncbi:MAG: pyruvate kinase [Alphaproteobacteria bacterium]